VESDSSGERRRGGSAGGLGSAPTGRGIVSGLRVRTDPFLTPRKSASGVSNCSAPANRESSGSVRGGRGASDGAVGLRSGACSNGRVFGPAIIVLTRLQRRSRPP